MSEVCAEHRVSVIEKIGYGLGDTASNIVFQMVMMFMAFFYTDIFGISAAAMGTLFLVVRIFDAITDPVMGALADGLALLDQSGQTEMGDIGVDHEIDGD